MDPRHANAIANHPEVRPSLGGDGVLDLTPIFTDASNVCFASAHGSIVCAALGGGVYDVHSLFLPEGRGKEALDLMRDVARFMFTATDCVEGRTTVPVTHRGAAMAARRSCFELFFTTRIPWSGGTRVEAEVFRLSLDRWALTCAQAAAMGAQFHEQLTAAKAAAGSPLPAHEHDPVHDHMVGATALMLLAGNQDKAVRFYNVWAQSVGYQTIELLRVRPIVLDVRDAIVEVTRDGMEVLACR